MTDRDHRQERAWCLERVTAGLVTAMIGVLVSAAFGLAQELPIDVYPDIRKPESRPLPSRPPDTPTRPPGAGTYPRDVGIGHEPAFVEPLAGEYSSNGGEVRYGVSGWTAPNVPVAGMRNDVREVPGYASFGFTIMWSEPH